jgi:hypothetical protein
VFINFTAVRCLNKSWHSQHGAGAVPVLFEVYVPINVPCDLHSRCVRACALLLLLSPPDCNRKCNVWRSAQYRSTAFHDSLSPGPAVATYGVQCLRNRPVAPSSHLRDELCHEECSKLPPNSLPDQTVSVVQTQQVMCGESVVRLSAETS